MSAAAWVLSVIYVLNGRAVSYDMAVLQNQEMCSTWQQFLTLAENDPEMARRALIATGSDPELMAMSARLAGQHNVFACRGVKSK